jgi:hypothetical protein
MVTCSKCSICDTLPARIHGHCQKCHAQITKMERENQTEQPVKFLTYRGMVVGLYPSKNKGMLSARVLTRSADKLPKAKTLDLNVFCEGFDRETIKRFKATVLSLAGAHPCYVKNK